MCNKDCWSCELEGCPYTLDISRTLDEEVIIENLRMKADNRVKRYRATRRGYEVKMEAKRRYEKKNPEKTALWSFKSRYKRKYGESPSQDICDKWVREREKKNKNSILYVSNA